jgi:hypothetical protein
MTTKDPSEPPTPPKGHRGRPATPTAPGVPVEPTDVPDGPASTGPARSAAAPGPEEVPVVAARDAGRSDAAAAGTARPAQTPLAAESATAAAPGPDPTRTVTLRLPLVTAIVQVPRRPQLPHVGRRDVAEAAGAARSLLPPPEQLLFYGGLGALAALEIIEWPIVAAVAAGTWVAQRGAGGRPERAVPAHRHEGATAAATA